MENNIRRRTYLASISISMAAAAGCSDISEKVGEIGSRNQFPDNTVTDPKSTLTITNAEDDWPTTGNDLENTGESESSFNYPDQFHKKWINDISGNDGTHGEIYTIPIAGDKLYAAVNRDGFRSNIYSINPKTGNANPIELQTYQVGGISLCNDNLYLTSPDTGVLSAISVKDNSRIWETEVPGIPDGSPKVTNGVVYGASGQVAVALDAKTGEWFWSAQNPSGDETFSADAVATDGDTVVASTKTKLIGLNSISGEFLWNVDFPTEEKDITAPVIKNNTVFHTHDDTGYALDIINGDILWEKSGSATKPLVSEELVVFTNNRGSGNSIISGYQIEGGEKSWEQKIPTIVKQPCTMCGEKLLIPGSDGFIYIFSLNSRSIIDKSLIGGVPTSEPIITGSKMFVGHRKGVTAFSRRLSKLENTDSWPMMSHDRRNSRRNKNATPPRRNIKVSEQRNDIRSGRDVLISDGLVVTSRSTLNARNLSTGEIRWSAIYGKSIVNNSRGGAHPIVFDGVVYDVSDGYVVAARLNDGEKLWQREIKETVYSPLTCTDRTLYIVTDSGQVLGFNLEDGRLVVDTSIYLSGTRGRAVHAPCAGAGRVYVPFGNKLAAIDRDQGGKVWDTRVTSSVVISPQNPSYLSNIVVTTTNLGDVHGYNASTGLEEWETRIFDGKAIMFRTSTYDEIVIGGGNPIQNQNKARVVGLDVRTGNEEWSYSLGQGTEIHGTPFIADELVWFITDNQNLIALQAENGRLVVKEKIQEIETLSNTNPVGVGERIIYYGYILSKYDKNR